MKKLFSIIASLTLCSSIITMTGDQLWWRQDNPRVPEGDNKGCEVQVVVDNICDGDNDPIAIAVVKRSDGYYWSVLTEQGYAPAYNPDENKYGKNRHPYKYNGIDKLKVSLRKSAVEPAILKPSDVEGNDPKEEAREKDGMVASACCFVSRNKAVFITIGASTGVAITFAYLTELYNRKYKKNISKMRVAATAWVATAVILGGGFYLTSGEIVEV